MDFVHWTTFTWGVSDNGLSNRQLYFSSGKIASEKPSRSFLAIASGETHVHDVWFLKSRHFLELSVRYALLITITENLKTFPAGKVPFCAFDKRSQCISKMIVEERLCQKVSFTLLLIHVLFH